MPANLPVEIRGDDGMTGTGYLRSLSLSGAMLATSLEMPLHASITLSRADAEPVISGICACVVRTQPDSVAIEWRDMASRQVIALIESVAPDAKGLETRDPYAA